MTPRPFWLENTQPSSGDDMYVRNAMHQQARHASDALFAALASLLGGPAPTLNFVTGGNPISRAGMSANVHVDGQPDNSVNMDPRTLAALVTSANQFHDWAVQGLPHEFSHLRQTPAVYADDALAEGGAQAFANLVTETAARRAKVPFRPAPDGFFDGDYAGYVQQAQALGRDYLLGGQFGHPGPITWP